MGWIIFGVWTVLVVLLVMFVHGGQRKPTPTHRALRIMNVSRMNEGRTRRPAYVKGGSEMKYDEAAFNDALNENMADDPYGTAMYVIGQALKGSIDADSMSEGEGKALRSIARAYVGSDPFVPCPVCGAHNVAGGDTAMRSGGYIDLDPGDPEVGPQPDVAACYICNLAEAIEQGWEE
jgi:hypothetical protein